MLKNIIACFKICSVNPPFASKCFLIVSFKFNDKKRPIIFSINF